MAWGGCRWGVLLEPTLVNACCESQLVLIMHNLKRFQKKSASEYAFDEWYFGSEDAFDEWYMWSSMFVTIQGAMNADVTSRNKILRTDIFNIQVEIIKKYKDWQEKNSIKKNPSVVKEDETIELQEVEDFDDPHPHGASIFIPIQTSLTSNSMFDAIGRYINQNDWALVLLTDGKNDGTHEVALYDPTIVMKHSIAERKDEFDKMSLNGSERTEKITLRDSIFDQLTKCVEFNKWESVILCGGDVHENVYEIGSKAEFEQGLWKPTFNIEMKEHIWDACQKGDPLHFEIRESTPLEIAKRFIPHRPDEAGESHEAEQTRSLRDFSR
jgi:hypothetical protein